MSERSSGEHRTVVETSKHPLVVLLVATLLGSVLVPYVNRRIDRDRRLGELKSERATAILRSAYDIERKLNLVTTEFSNFYKDQTPGASTTASQDVLRTQVYKLYEEFNRDAWWWHWQLLEEATILGLVDDRSHATLERSVRGYHDALVASTSALDPIWAALLRRRRSDRVEAVGDTIGEATTRLSELTSRRQQFVREMVEAILH